jgi:hypothetical protein
MKDFNFHWPATKYNNKVPWYTVVRRSIFFVPVFAALFVSLFFVTLGWGFDTAKEIWDDIT